MQWTTDVRARWLGGAFLLATLGALVLLAARTPGASADAAGGTAEAPICDAGDAHAVDTNGQIADVLQQTRIQLEQSGASDGETIVLNNRGYNYGPAPGVEFDALLGDVAAQSAARH